MLSNKEVKSSPPASSDKLENAYGEARIEKLSAGDTYDTDPALDKRVTRKFDRHIIPWLFGIW
jgi:hypothetical protein